MNQWKQTPELRIEDAYKWLFQATLGGEHALNTHEGARLWLEREWRSIGDPLPGERTIQKLDPQGIIVRCNLRPYKKSGQDMETLWRVFIWSAEGFKTDKKVFTDVWKQLGDRLRTQPQGHLNFLAWKRLDSKTRAEGYPAIHHSPEYEKEYKPAYRVIKMPFPLPGLQEKGQQSKGCS